MPRYSQVKKGCTMSMRGGPNSAKQYIFTFVDGSPVRGFLPSILERSNVKRALYDGMDTETWMNRKICTSREEVCALRFFSTSAFFFLTTEIVLPRDRDHNDSFFFLFLFFLFFLSTKKTNQKG